MFIYIFIVFAIISLLFFAIKKVTHTTSKENNSHPQKKDAVIDNVNILKNMNSSNGNYALYIRHKKYGKFMVLDQEALKKNRNKLKVKLSFINYLPGEGDRSYGVILFKNNQLLTAKTGGVFNAFEIGDLMNYAKPVNRKSFQGIKYKVQQKLDSIKNDKQAFLLSGATFVPDNRAFRFRVYFSSIAVPVTRKKDTNGVKQIATVNGIDFDTWTMNKEIEFEKKWANKLKKRIQQKATGITGYCIDISWASLSDTYLFSGNLDLKSKDGHVLYINDYMYYIPTAYISANEKNAEQLFSLDFSDCLTDDEINRPQVIKKMKDLIKQSNYPNLDIDKDEVGLLEYKDEVTKYDEIYQQDYEIRWLEIPDK